MTVKKLIDDQGNVTRRYRTCWKYGIPVLKLQAICIVGFWIVADIIFLSSGVGDHESAEWRIDHLLRFRKRSLQDSWEEPNSDRPNANDNTCESV